MLWRQTNGNAKLPLCFTINTLVMEEYGPLHVLAICQLLKHLWDLNIFLTQDHWGWQFQTTTPPTVFIQFQPNLATDILVTGEHCLLQFIAICQIIKTFITFEILIWESIGNLICEVSQERLPVEYI